MAEPRRRARKHSGELALLAGVGRSTVQALEGGKNTVQLDSVVAVADALGCDIALRAPDRLCHRWIRHDSSIRTTRGRCSRCLPGKTPPRLTDPLGKRHGVSIRQHLPQRLLCAGSSPRPELTVSRIPQSGHDYALIVELIVDGGTDHADGVS